MVRERFIEEVEPVKHFEGLTGGKKIKGVQRRRKKSFVGASFMCAQVGS